VDQESGHSSEGGETGRGPDRASPPPEEALRKIAEGRNIWIATVRPGGRPHLVPVWFVWVSDCFYIAVDPDSVKARNLQMNPHVAVALEDGSQPVICEGVATVLPSAPGPAAEAFRAKYDWTVERDDEYSAIIRIVPSKWLVW
jgi:PPOX class probable F420-dependent enzyme